MNGLDAVLGVILFGVVAVEAARGFGQTLFDALMLYGALWATDLLLPYVLPVLTLAASPAANRGLVFGALLALLSGLALLCAHLLHRQTQIDAGSCERLFGLIGGVAVAMMVAHGLMRLVAINLAGGSEAPLLAGSFLGNEMLSFTTYHSLITSLTSDAPLHRTVPG